MRQQPVVGARVDLPPAEADRLSALFDAHADRLYRLARRLVSSADDALDLVQETFLKAARAPRSIPFGKSNEEAWLVRVLVNVRRDQWRKEAVRRRHVQDLTHLPAAHNDPEQALVIGVTVWKALDHLSPRRRAILIMHEIEELPTRSISTLLGISAMTVRWHLSRGRRDLARHLRLEQGASDAGPQTALAASRPSPSRSSAR